MKGTNCCTEAKWQDEILLRNIPFDEPFSNRVKTLLLFGYGLVLNHDITMVIWAEPMRLDCDL
jgi:hypothetical protein